MLVLAVLQTQLELIMLKELQEIQAHSQQSLQLVVVEVVLMQMPLLEMDCLVVLEEVVDTAAHQMLLDQHQDQE